MEFGPSVVPELREILLSTGEGEFYGPDGELTEVRGAVPGRMAPERTMRHLAISRAEVFSTVGNPLPTSYVSNVPKVLQMDRRGHAMSGMDAVYVHPTPEMRQQLCDYLQQLWQQAIAERYKLAPRSAVPLLDEILIGHEKSLKAEHEQADATRTPEVLTRTRRQQAHQADRGRSRG